VYYKATELEKTRIMFNTYKRNGRNSHKLNINNKWEGYFNSTQTIKSDSVLTEKDI